MRMVAASLVCGGSGGSVAANTTGFALSNIGNADFETTLTLPARCAAPVVLVRVFTATNPAATQLGSYIAISGIESSSTNSSRDDSHDGEYYE